MTSTEEYLRERYGSTDGKNRVLWLGGAIAGIIIVAWLIWQAIAITSPQAHAEVLGSTVHSDSAITVRYNVTSDLGQTVRCTVRAFSDTTLEVGVKEIDTTITTQPTTVEVDLITTQRAARGDVSSCTIVK